MYQPTIYCLFNGSSQYDVLTHYQEIYLTEFKKKGYKISDITTEGISSVQHPQNFMFLVGGLGNQWKQLFNFLPIHIPILNVITDHPYYYFPLGETRITHLPICYSNEFSNFYSRYHQKTLRSPMAALPLISPGFTVKNSDNVPFTKKTNAVLVAGTIDFPDEIKQNFYDSYSSLKHIFDELISLLIERDDVIIDVLLDHFLEQGHQLNKLEHLDFYKVLYYGLDKYSRSYYRLCSIKAIAHTNVPVIFLGKQSEKLNHFLKYPKNFEFREAVTFTEFIRLIGNVKIVLTNTYQNGIAYISERMPTAMLNGSISVHPYSPHLQHLLTEGKEGFSYHWKSIEELPVLLESLLNDPMLCEEVSFNAKAKAKNYTMEKSAEQILEQLPNFRRLINQFLHN